MNTVLLATQYNEFMFNWFKSDITSLILAEKAHDSIDNKEYGD